MHTLSHYKVNWSTNSTQLSNVSATKVEPGCDYAMIPVAKKGWCHGSKTGLLNLAEEELPEGYYHTPSPYYEFDSETGVEFTYEHEKFLQ